MNRINNNQRFDYYWRYLYHKYPDLQKSSNELKNELDMELKKKHHNLNKIYANRIYLLYHRKLYIKICYWIRSNKHFDSIIRRKIFQYLHVY